MGIDRPTALVVRRTGEALAGEGGGRTGRATIPVERLVRVRVGMSVARLGHLNPSSRMTLTSVSSTATFAEIC